MKILLTTALALLSVSKAVEFTECGCTGDRNADIDRIEYQIPMEKSTFQGNSIGAVEDFIEYLDEVLEDNLFHGIFDIKKDKDKQYFRSDRTKEVTYESGAPKSSGIKYRQTIDQGWYEKYQNDLSWQMGYGLACSAVQPADDYAHVYNCKTEANMFADSCTMNHMTGTDHAGAGDSAVGVGFTGRLEFDDDDQWGHNDTDAQVMVREGTFTNFGVDCTKSKLNTFFSGACSFYSDGIGPVVSVDKDVFNYVRDVTFEVNYINETGFKSEVSKGKLTWQIRFDTMEDWRMDRCTGRETEMSIKAYRTKTETMDNACGPDQDCWEYTVGVLSQVADAITKCGYPWIRYEDSCVTAVDPSCPSLRPTMAPTHSPGYVPMCCSALAGEKRRWKNKCPNWTSESDCHKGRRDTHCAWNSCA